MTVVATTPKGAFSLLKVVFMKNDGSVYVPFPYLGEKRGLLSEIEPATEPDPKTVNLTRAGIVVDYDVKCSFHTSGTVQFSKSGERDLLPRRKGFPLKEATGRHFEFRAYGLEGFEQVDLGTPTKDYRVLLRFPVHPTSIVVSGIWQRKKDIVTNMDGGVVGPDTTLIRRSDGFAQPGLFVGQPLGLPFPEVPIERLSIYGSNSGFLAVDNPIRSQIARRKGVPRGSRTRVDVSPSESDDRCLARRYAPRAVASPVGIEPLGTPERFALVA